jgi:glycosyltransferase involved in cell wall biosynthesis
MKLLIIVGFVIPKAAEYVNESSSTSGGWVTGLIDGLSKIKGLDIGVAMKSSLKSLKTLEVENVKYYYLPTKKLNKFDVNIQDCKTVLAHFKPDILHVEGAEVYIANRFLSYFGGKKIISIKGVFYNVQEHEYGGLELHKLILSFNISKIVYGITQYYIKNIRFRKRKDLEKRSYELSDYVIGRTIYDNAHALNLNKNLRYFYNSESLRGEFYDKNWKFKNVDKYSVFIGNGSLARKGAHSVVNAVSILKDEFPLIKLYIVGTNAKSIKDKLTYKGYLDSLIKKNKLERLVVFLGNLDARQMAEEMVKKHVFVLPSFVENSSNTLGEAMLMGLPSVVSFSGGVSSLASDEKEVLFYRPSDSVMLIHQIRRVFNDEINILALSENSRKKAAILYDRKHNTETLIKIYKNIINDNNYEEIKQ